VSRRVTENFPMNDFDAKGRRPKVRTKPAADYVGSTESSMNKYRLYGGGPKYIKIGRTVVYDLDDLDAWLETKKRTSTSVAA
jgi:predicted DNA-binding transcriptional regulator AlpA